MLGFRNAFRVAVVTGALLAGSLAGAGSAHAAGTTITVDTLTDPNPTTSASTCSLRQAVIAANDNTPVGTCPAGSSSDPDLIILDPGDYHLTQTGSDDPAAISTTTPDPTKGDLDITGSVTIEGSSNPTGVDWSDVEAHPDRIFDVHGESPGITVNILAITVANGSTAEESSLHKMGGDIRVGDSNTSNPATLNLVDVTVENGQTTTWGGGIAVQPSGTLNLLNTTVISNNAPEGAGLGTNSSSTTSIDRSVIINNTAGDVSGSKGMGGGIENRGTMSLVNSSVLSNLALSGGGASAVVRGGAISNDGNAVGLSNVTVSDNSTFPNGATGSTTDDDALSGPFEMKSSILANNDSSHGHDCSATATNITSDGYNIVEGYASPGDSTHCWFTPKTGDKLGVDPGLGGFGENGGPTESEVPTKGSPAVDAIPPSDCKAIGGLAALSTDQRGVPRPQGTNCDIGAVERMARPAKPTMLKPDTPFQRSLVMPNVWTGIDTPLGPATYDLRVTAAHYNQSDFSLGTFTGLSDNQMTTQRFRGITYCFTSRATDIDGNASPYSNRTCSAMPLDDRELTRSKGDWTTVSKPAFFVGRASTTKAQGASLSIAGVRAKRLAVMTDVCPTCGQIELLLGGTKVAHFDLHAGTTRHRQLFIKSFSSLRTGTAKVEVTSSGQKVVIDGLGVSRV